MRRMYQKKQGFSLVESAIVILIVGIIFMAMTFGKKIMLNEEAKQAYKKVVLPCLSGLSQATGTLKVPEMQLSNTTLQCIFSSSTGGIIDKVTLLETSDTLKNLIQENLHKDMNMQTEANKVSITYKSSTKNPKPGAKNPKQ